MAEVPFVGLTGGLGAGKSTALAALARLGAEVISSDAVVHELYGGDELRDAVRRALRRGGRARRRRRPRCAGQRAFATDEDRAWLESLVWPMVGARVAAWLERARAKRRAPPAAVVEVPLLFEAGLEGIYDATIAVVSDEGLGASAPRHAGTQLVDERAARQLTQRRRRRGDIRRAQRRHRGGPAARNVGGSCQARGVIRARLGSLAAFGIALMCAVVLASRAAASTRAPRLPLADTGIIRAQASEKQLDPALIAAVIYAESKFEPSESSAGRAGADADPARDRLLPRPAVRAGAGSPRATSARRASTSRTAATTCATCSTITTATRCWRSPPTTAASRTSTAGWRTPTREGRSLSIEEIPFPETREYVQRVLSAQQSYRAQDAQQLGID